MKSKRTFLRQKSVLKIFPVLLIMSMVFLSVGCARYSHKDINTIPIDDFRKFSAKIYFIDQKFWTIGDKFTISDEQGIPLFFVKERVITVGDRLSFMDARGKMIFNIKQKVLSLLKQFRIYTEKHLVARVIKKFRPFNDKFVVDLPESDDYIVRGDFINHRYSFFRDGRKVAQISKKWGTLGDNYMVQIGPHENDLIILATAVIIDMSSHKDES